MLVFVTQWRADSCLYKQRSGTSLWFSGEKKIQLLHSPTTMWVLAKPRKGILDLNSLFHCACMARRVATDGSWKNSWSRRGNQGGTSRAISLSSPKGHVNETKSETCPVSSCGPSAHTSTQGGQATQSPARHLNCCFAYTQLKGQSIIRQRTKCG